VVIKDPEETFAGIECNCYLAVKSKVDYLPRMAEIIPNAEPFVGGVAVEYFGNVKHVSLITEVRTDGAMVWESNYHHCTVSTRFIPYTQHSLVGYWVAG